jgi:hypothetical protein
VTTWKLRAASVSSRLPCYASPMAFAFEGGVHARVIKASAAVNHSSRRRTATEVVVGDLGSRSRNLNDRLMNVYFTRSCPFRASLLDGMDAWLKSTKPKSSGATRDKPRLNRKPLADAFYKKREPVKGSLQIGGSDRENHGHAVLPVSFSTRRSRENQAIRASIGKADNPLARSCTALLTTEI